MQPVPNPAKSAPVQAVGCQLIQECAVGDSVKGLAEIQIDNIHSPSCTHQMGHLVIKGDQVGQTPPTSPKPVLAGPENLAILGEHGSGHGWLESTVNEGVWSWEFYHLLEYPGIRSFFTVLLDFGFSKMSHTLLNTIETEGVKQLNTLPKLSENPSAVSLLKVKEQQVPIATSIVHRRQYRTTRDAVIPIHKMICELESQGVVSKTHSPFNSPIWPVRKSDRKWRLTVDYRALNEVTPPLSAAVPDMLKLQYELESKAAK
ncbi:hypothetical protein DUI87_15959 [Hirundo rustica rustica]|uniref:Reverse transcriptase domain-containing protein n=1 Tax=Hirundo rustica rustica TaxID=333673 RepID=A0A3M0JZX3_HIRRU|nr:hypothetical protein DUI87_15959 [Hirundo rustica rustica]